MSEIERALEVLGLCPDSTTTEIKQAYRDLAKVWHPDRFPNDARLRKKAEEKLKEINAAYRALKDYNPPPKENAHNNNSSYAQSSASPNREQGSSGSSTPPHEESTAGGPRSSGSSFNNKYNYEKNKSKSTIRSYIEKNKIILVIAFIGACVLSPPLILKIWESIKGLSNKIELQGNASYSDSIYKVRSNRDGVEGLSPRIEARLKKWFVKKMTRPKSWSFSPPGLEIKEGDIYSVANAINGNNIWVIIHDKGWGEYVLNSKNGGKSWKIQWEEGNDRSHSNTYVVFFYNEYEGVFGGEYRMFTTKDGGANWQLQSRPTDYKISSGGRIEKYSFYKDGRVAIHIETGKIFESSDGCQSWHEIK